MQNWSNATRDIDGSHCMDMTLSAGHYTVNGFNNLVNDTYPIQGWLRETSQQEIGFVDSAGAANGAATVAQGSTLYAGGWAADTVGGAPVQSVTVYVDGNNTGTADLGFSRPDVATAYNRSIYTLSGWRFQVSTSSLSVGTHSVTAKATGPQERLRWRTPKRLPSRAPVGAKRLDSWTRREARPGAQRSHKAGHCKPGGGLRTPSAARQCRA
jgi:hypothetical protein